jgi:signal transduction histidine kinase/ActR/RegA family two-component response regulator
MRLFRAYIYILFFALFLVKTGDGFSSSSILNPDTVKQLLENASEEQKIEILLSHSEKAIGKNPNEAIEYATMALFLATETNDISNKIKSQLHLARAYIAIGNYSLAIEKLDNTYSLCIQSKDSIGLIDTHQLWGITYTRIGDFMKALNNAQEAFNLAGRLNAKEKLSELSREIGNIYFYFGESIIALDFYLKSLKISEEIKNIEGIAKAYNNMGRIHSELGNYDLALDYLKKSLSSKIREEDRISYANSLLNIGTVYLKRGDFEKAIYFFQESNNDFSLVKNPEGMANSLYYQGLAYFQEKRYNQALAIQEEAWKIASESDANRLLVLINVALSEIYAEIGDFRRAYNHAKLYKSLRDTVFGDEKAKLLIELETRYQLHAKQRQIELLSKEKELKDSEENRSRVWIAFLSIVALFFITLTYFSYSRYRFKSKANEKLLQEIRHRKSVEAELTKYQDHLESIVEERTWELKVAKNKAEESDMLKTAFLSNMSHEIRTPMNAIVGFSYLLADNNSSEEVKNDYVKIIKNNGEVLMNLINDILDISMIESGQLKTKSKPFYLVELLNELKVYFEQEKENFKKESISIITDYDTDLTNLILDSDSTRIRQILSNLLSNALKFTEKGQINFGYRQSNENELVFFVRDTGIGINPENHQAIFDRFSKFTGTNESTFYAGTGLGLAICSELVSLLGGRIWLDSHPGKGSTFYFTLPYEANNNSQAEPSNKSIEISKDQLKGKTILIAEDVLGNYQLLKAFLSDSDVRILWAQTGVEALDLFSKNRNIDIILMDIQLPIMNGLKALQQIRQLDKTVPIIVNSAFFMNEEREKSFAAGCSDYISKPIRKVEFLNMLVQFVSQVKDL